MKLELTICAAALFALTLAGCGDDSNTDNADSETTTDDATDESVGNEQSEADMGDGDGDAGDGDGDTGDGDGDGDTGDGDGDTGDGDGDTGDGDGDTGDGDGDGDGDPGLCQPDLDDNPCDACTKTMCCDELTACMMDDTCVCLIDCIGGGMAQLQCFQDCGVNGPPAAFVDLSSCAGAQCGNQCL